MNADMLIVKGNSSKSLFNYNITDVLENMVLTYQEKAWINEAIGEHLYCGAFFFFEELWFEQTPNY